MKKEAFWVKLLYFRTTFDLNEIKATLRTSAIESEAISFDNWLNAKHAEKANALLLILDHNPSGAHLFSAVFDLGLPVLILRCKNPAQPWVSTSSTCKELIWPNDKGRLASALRDMSAQPAPVPLYMPNLAGMEELNALSIFGTSNIFLKITEEIRRFSRSQAPVLIHGETGTGKELGARALHYLGPRKKGPFVPVNCSSLPDTLFENEFFGHAKGAYTGAQDNHAGLLAHAEGGTLFLDEIDSLQPRAQASLLRYLQDKKYRPLGSSKLIDSETSVVAASNQNLANLVSQGRFREDLLYRINTITVTFPPPEAAPGGHQPFSPGIFEKIEQSLSAAAKIFSS